MINSSDKFSGSVMRSNQEVARIENDALISVDPAAPLYLQNFDSFDIWITDRGCDFDRTNMRAIARALGLPMHNSRKAAESVFAACITDDFWIRPQHSGVSFKETRFQSNLFFNAALQGDSNIFEIKESHTPELTNIGSFEKGWNLADGIWRLYKANNPLQGFSEIFVSSLAQQMGMYSVRYWKAGNYTVCENFVPYGYSFEPAKAVIGENTDYAFTLERFERFGLGTEYLQLLFLDALTFNIDRHEFNFGLLTGGRIMMAPNFDNNMALFGYKLPENFKRKPDPLITDFCSLAKVRGFHIPDLTDDMIKSAYEDAGNEVLYDDVYTFIRSSYEIIISKV